MDKVNNFFSKIWEFIKKFHWYGWLGVALVIGFQTSCYYLGRTIAEVSGATAHAFSPKIDVIDNAFPLVPGFIFIYIIAFVYWGVAILAAALTEDKEYYINTIIAAVICSLIGAIILAACPTYLDRTAEGIGDVYGKPGFINWLITRIYASDGGRERGTNLLPSFHCMTAFSAALGTFRRKESPLWWRISSVVLVILICLSTLFTKQHYFLDVVTAFAISVSVFIIVKLFNPGKPILNKITSKSKKQVKK